MGSSVAERTTGRALVPDDLFERLTEFLAREDNLTEARAARIIDQALAFLMTLAGHEGKPLSPSRAVDPGWHTFVLHTREYAEWCQNTAGRFMHHNPLPGSGARDGIAVRRTVAAMEAAGFAVDRCLWGVAADCNEPTCDGDDGRDY